MSKLRPIVLVALSQLTQESAKKIYTHLIEVNPDLENIVKVIGFSSDGGVRDLLTDQVMHKVSDLGDQIKAKVWQTNFEKIEADSDAISKIIGSAIRDVNRTDVQTDLGSKGIKLSSKTSVFFLTTTYDPVGSAAIIPFQESLDKVAEKLQGLHVTSNLLLFLPDLFMDTLNPENDAKKDLSLVQGRSFSCLNEIDTFMTISRLNEVDDAPTKLRYVWLFGAKNNKGRTVNNVGELQDLLNNMSEIEVYEEISDKSGLSSALLEIEDEQHCYYSGIGFTEIIFPRSEVEHALLSFLGKDILGERLEVDVRNHPPGVVQSDTQKFFSENKMLSIIGELKIDKDGQKIYTPFRYSGKKSEDRNVESFLSELESEVVAHELNAFNDQMGILSRRRHSLQDDILNKLKTRVQEMIDSREQGLGYCNAYLQTLVRKESEYLYGDVYSDSKDLKYLRSEAYSFFDRKLALEDTRRYFQDIDNDLKSKNNKLEEYKSNLSIAQGKIESKEVEDGDPSYQIYKDQIQSLQNKIETLEPNVEIIKNQHEGLKDKLDDNDVVIEDATNRRSVLDDLIIEMESAYLEKSNKLPEIDKKYQAAKRALDSAKDIYNSQRINAFFIYPIMLSLLFLGLATIFYYGTFQLGPIALPIQYEIISYVQALAAAIIFYFGIAYAFFKFFALVALQNAIDRYENISKQKVQFLTTLETLRVKRFELMFEFSLHGHLLDLSNALINYTADMSVDVALWIDSLQAIKDQNQYHWDNLTFQDPSPFSFNIMSKPYVEKLIISQEQGVSIVTKRFFDEKTPYQYFSENRGPNAIEARSVKADIKDKTDKLFADFLAQNIEEIVSECLADAGQSDNVCKHALDNALESLSPFINLKELKPIAEEVTIATLSSADTKGTQFKRYVSEQQRIKNLDYGYASYQDAIHFVNIKAGFPVFQVTDAQQWRDALQGEASKCTIKPNWQLNELFPTKVTRGRSKSSQRKALVFGLAYGLILRKNGEFEYDGLVLGKTIENAQITLGGKYHLDKKKNLLAEIDLFESENDGASLKKLTKFAESNKDLDDVDLEIIQDKIEILDVSGP